MANGRGSTGGNRPSRPLIHYRRIPGTRRYYNPRNPSEVVSDRYVQQYRSSLTEQQRREVTSEARRVATWRHTHKSNVAAIYQRKIEASGGTYGPSERADFSSLYARLQQLKIEQSALTGIPEEAGRRRALLAPNGEYAQILEELGRRPANADWEVGASPEGTVAAMWPSDGG